MRTMKTELSSIRGLLSGLHGWPPRLLVAAIVALLLGLMPSWVLARRPSPTSGPACSIAWVGPSGIADKSGSWTTAANWDANRVPTSADDVCINLAGAYTVALSQSVSIHSLTIGDASATLEVQNSITLTAASDSSNAGTITLVQTGGGCANGTLALTSGTLTSTGTLNFNSCVPVLAASLANSGTVNVGGFDNTTFNKTNGVYTNTGTFTVSTSLSVVGTSPTFNQNGGTLTINASFGQTGGAF
ncbi:MAG: hypothetical protein ACYDCQ_20840, partial [Dehalococcoidia bacterium]